MSNRSRRTNPAKAISVLLLSFLLVFSAFPVQALAEVADELDEAAGAEDATGLIEDVALQEDASLQEGVEFQESVELQESVPEEAGVGLAADATEDEAASDYLASGTWGTCPWEISADGVLTVHPGTGADARYQNPSSPWADYAESVWEVVFATEGGERVVAPQNSARLLYSFSNATVIDVSNLDVSQVKNMGGMFNGCSSVTSLDVSSWDTSNVTGMEQLFWNCSSLGSLDLTSWDTSNVTNMTQTFYGCSSLRSLDLTSWDTSSVKYMRGLFASCSSLETIYVTELWSTDSVANTMYGSMLFTGCENLRGGNGTGYSSDNTDVSYARIDGLDGHPGYLTGFTRDIAGADIQEIPNQVFTGSDITPEVTVIYDGETLVEGSDYRVTFENNRDAGEAGAVVRGIGGYSGEVNLEFLIDAAPLDGCSFAFDATAYTEEGVPSYDYYGQEIVPTIVATLGDYTLVEGTDYVVTFDGNDSFGEAHANIEGAGNFSGGMTLPFMLVDSGLTPISRASIAPIPDQTYTGEAIEPELSVTSGGATLLAGTDYVVSYANNTNMGIATATIQGIGAYTGTTSITFNIVAMGTWGTCPWVISPEGVLTVYPGEGASQRGQQASPWVDYMTGIKKLVIASEDGQRVIAPEDSSYLFGGLYYLESLDASGLDTSSVTNMSGMFVDCVRLDDLDLSAWDVSSVENMAKMFSNYGTHIVYDPLTLDLSAWDVSSVQDMSKMFCTAALLVHSTFRDGMHLLQPASRKCSGVASILSR